MPKSLFHFIFLLSLLSLSSTSLAAKPKAKFSSLKSVKVMDPVVFTNESQKASRYEWDFGDGNTATDVSPTHRYWGSGEYVVTLTAYDAKGKKASTSKKIMVTPPDRCLIGIETPFGKMVAQLYDATPLHQDNFVKLVEQQFYDSLLFHRIINGFMVQGGDPISKENPPSAPVGTGGPGYTIKAEILDSLAHVKGALAAARTQNPQKRSSGSQFYIVQGRPVTDADLNRLEAEKGFRYPTSLRSNYLANGGTPFLDQDYTVFGQVIEGLDIIDQLAAVRTDANNKPLEDCWMIIRLIR